MPEVNDAQSRLNPTHVKSILSPRSEEEVRKAILTAAEAGDSISMAGGRHSMGGQQFGTGTVHFDLYGMDRIVEFNRPTGPISIDSREPTRERPLRRTSSSIWVLRVRSTGRMPTSFQTFLKAMTPWSPPIRGPR